MRNSLILIAVIVTPITLFCTSRSVAAQGMDFGQYRDAMYLFAPEVEDWIKGFEELAVAAEVKPETRCSEELMVLAENGRRIVGDLQGTALLAPRALVPDHDAITGGVAVMAQVANDACSTRVSLLAATRAERRIAARAMMHLQVVLQMQRPIPKELPPQPHPSSGLLPGVAQTPM